MEFASTAYRPIAFRIGQRIRVCRIRPGKGATRLALRWVGRAGRVLAVDGEEQSLLVGIGTGKKWFYFDEVTA